jgi:hypothetical protein
MRAGIYKLALVGSLDKLGGPAIAEAGGLLAAAGAGAKALYGLATQADVHPAPQMLYTLTLGKSGDGDGTVTASPAGPTYAAGTVITLTPKPAKGSEFGGWSGGGANVITMNSDVSATAIFNLANVNLAWQITASVSFAGGSRSYGGTVSIPRDGGSAHFSSSGASFTVTVAGGTMTLSGSGFGQGAHGSGSGSGGGSGAVTETLTSYAAAGPLDGSVHIVLDDGSSYDYALSGSFSATAAKPV